MPVTVTVTDSAPPARPGAARDSEPASHAVSPAVVINLASIMVQLELLSSSFRA
jgi:hypothetical protein